MLFLSSPKFHRLHYLLLFFALISFNRCTSQNNMETQSPQHKHTNKLIHETSPYLLQHAHNPVDWYPWGEEALQKAKDENKLIIVSVGYAACHWCHVMEHESFEDSTVAAQMNESFVCIKVDREERPDIDQIYMDAVQLIRGNGGWPLNCFALPDGRPLWGGTYFQREQWMSAMEQMRDLWEKKPEEAKTYAENLTRGVQQVDDILPNVDKKPFEQANIDSTLERWRGSFDMREGGRNRAPKFPLPNNWLFLMRIAHFQKDQQIEDAVNITLKKIAWGGIYDHVGGGFARYSTDKFWKVPHFEKMTYDNGQLVSLYSEAYLKDPDPLYKRVVYETLAYTKREMTSPEGGFYSSLDADSEGEEGKFYVFKKAEIDAILGDDSDWFCEYYDITERGNWEHGNSVLIMKQSPADFAEKKGMSEKELLEKLEKAKKKVFKERAKRIRPGLDDKILVSWNALMLKGYVDAWRAFGEKEFLDAALKNAKFIEDKLRDGDRLNRNYKAGRATINAFLDDYALLAEAYIELYEATLDAQWLHRSKALVDYTIDHFFDDKSGMFFFTSDQDPALIARKKELMDNVIPGSNSVMANVLFELSHFFGEKRYLEISTQMLHNVKQDMQKYGSAYSNWGILMLKHLHPFYEVVIAGTKFAEMAREMDKHYIPNKLLVAAKKEEKGQIPLLDYRFLDEDTHIFVCQNSVCQLPVKEVKKAVDLMKTE